MSINKIYCVGDGYAHGHIWPEWPQILQALLPEQTVETLSGIGAGEEFLITKLIDCDPVNSDVIFQWPQPCRFDKLIQDAEWLERAKKDPVYHFNLYESSHGVWWLSSASQDSMIKLYKEIVQENQLLVRYSIFKKLAEGYLKSKNCRYIETSNQEQESTTEIYKHLRGNEVQPSPIMHYYFLIDNLIPRLNYVVDHSWAKTLENRILAHKWNPYDPDREEIWNIMSKQP